MQADTPTPPVLSRRAFLSASGALGLGCLGSSLVGAQGCAAGTPLAAAIAAVSGGCPTDFGPLQPADANSLMLPAGFTSRVVARSGKRVGATSHIWHREPDGGATFATPNGGWIYVSNSERSRGGAGAIAFAADGSIQDAYSILRGTTRNCAGGATPWGTWLSCEEVVTGQVYECDPFTPGSQGVARPALGWFMHEAAAVDPIHQRVYLTEDQPDGRLYRFSPTTYPSLAAGTLEAAEILDPDAQGAIQPGQTRPVVWHEVSDPNPAPGDPPTRDQVPAATRFRGGEGCWIQNGLLSFTTKHDNRVWQLDLATDTITILYDFKTSRSPVLSGTDNVYTTACGDVYVAEDGGNLEIVALTPSGGVFPIARLTQAWLTEITGPALSPDGTRLYFSSQRFPGITYEVTGAFDPTPVAAGFGAPWMVLWLGALGAAALRARRPTRESADTQRAEDERRRAPARVRRGAEIIADEQRPGARAARAPRRAAAPSRARG